MKLTLAELVRLARAMADACRKQHDARMAVFMGASMPERGSIAYQRAELDIKEKHGDLIDAAVNAELALILAVNRSTDADLDELLKLAQWAQENG